ncbi:unnamed protein product [Discula destructiva]
MIIIQLHLPCTFHPLPHQQQFQHRLSASNGHRGSGHLGSSGDMAAVDGLPSKLGGIGYAIDCIVRFRQGLRFEDGDLVRVLSFPLLLLLLSPAPR